MIIHVENVNPKMTREVLCRVQTTASPLDKIYLQRIIDGIDILRPLDSDGKHRSHTANCEYVF